MRIIIITLFISFLSCKNRTQTNLNVDKSISANTIVLNVCKTTLLIKGVSTINDSNNVNNDYNIQRDENQITLTPVFLESDLLDNKKVEFIGEEFSKVEISFKYDAIFYGEEKTSYILGFETDTIFDIDVKNREFLIPNSDELKKNISKKFKQDKLIEKAYLFNKKYYQNIKENPNMFGISDYEDANKFFKKEQSDFTSLEELLTEIDYSKITLKFFDNNKEKFTVVYDRGFKEITLNNDINAINRTGYYNLESVQLKLKSNEYKIEVLEKKDLQNKENIQHNSNPILIFKKSNNDFLILKENNQLIFDYNDNCPADGYSAIVTKNEYFTIEQVFCSDFLFVNSYATFKIDENSSEIYLYKYGEEYADRSNPDRKIPTQVWTTKDFGEVLFENVTEDFLLKLRLKEHLNK